MRKTVFVAMSGGVDSSVAAALLKERGFGVIGIYMKNWTPHQSRFQRDDTGQADPYDRVCRQQYQDRVDAMRVAATLGIPFKTWDFTEEYRRMVVAYMIHEYAAGRTPNPDVMCNREIKFGLFLKRALEAGADYIATGHYVRIRAESEKRIADSHIDVSPPAIRYTLYAARDDNKDQSYFLWTLTQEQLYCCLFPLGEYAKPEVRALAKKFDLPTAEKPDSQGICFIGKVDIRRFLGNHIPEQKGQVVTGTGTAVGEHRGVAFHTIGQRKGLGIGGGVPYYVAAKDVVTNTLVVAEGPHNELLFQREVWAGNVGWISGQEPEFPLWCHARIRYRQPLQACSVERIADSVCLRFDEPQRAVTPGQSVVFYQDDQMLGGGIIGEQPLPKAHEKRKRAVEAKICTKEHSHNMRERR